MPRRIPIISFGSLVTESDSSTERPIESAFAPVAAHCVSSDPPEIRSTRNLRRFGYSTSGGELVPDEREQAVVARMRGLKVKGCSLRGLAQRLNDEGLRPKRGER